MTGQERAAPVRSTRAAQPPGKVDLNAELERANGLIETAETDRDKARADATAARKENGELIIKVNGLQDSLAEQRKVVVEAEDGRLAAERELAACQRDLTAARDAGRQLAECLDARDTAERDIAAAHAAVERLTTTLDAERTRNARLAEELSHEQANVAGLDNAARVMRQERAAFAENLRAEQTEARTLEKAAAARLAASWYRPKRLAVAHAEAKGAAQAYYEITARLP